MTGREKSEDYRRRAAKCLQMAKRAPYRSDKVFLLELAFRWHMLAQGVASDPQNASNGTAVLRSAVSKGLH